MKRSLFEPAEPFSLSPLLSILPVLGDIGKLEPLTASFFARYEKVVALQREGIAEGQRESSRRFAAEEGMLRVLLDRLEMQPEGAPKTQGGNDE